MITVIIPALNEEETITSVIQLVKKSQLVSEIIVVDDKSADNTVQKAREEGATVITSTKLGKGASMKDGILVAKNEIITFLDADITTYPDNIIELLCEPIISGNTDFTKSFFTRQAGRVTELVAKPLLSIIYPDFPNFKQPLSGMIAGKKSLFTQIEFEDGYGVDIGILIDMYNLNAKIAEVNIGEIENRMRSLDQLGKMSREVAKTILKKSKWAQVQNLETYENIQIIREQMDFAIRESLTSLKKIAVFDMDYTILRASFIHTAAREFGFSEQLIEVITNNDSPFVRTKHIARFLKGKSIGDLLAIVDLIPVTPHFKEAITELKSNGYIVGIISDSYDCITNHLKNKYDLDFTLANELEFSKSIATGEVKIPSLFLSFEKSICKHDYCKLNALIHLSEKYGVGLKNILVIGDSENDICSVKNAGIGISFCSTNSILDAVADYVIKQPDFDEIISIIR